MTKKCYKKAQNEKEKKECFYSKLPLLFFSFFLNLTLNFYFTPPINKAHVSPTLLAEVNGQKKKKKAWQRLKSEIKLAQPSIWTIPRTRPWENPLTPSPHRIQFRLFSINVDGPKPKRISSYQSPFARGARWKLIEGPDHLSWKRQKTPNAWKIMHPPMMNDYMTFMCVMNERRRLRLREYLWLVWSVSHPLIPCPCPCYLLCCLGTDDRILQKYPNPHVHVHTCPVIIKRRKIFK